MHCRLKPRCTCVYVYTVGIQYVLFVLFEGTTNLSFHHAIVCFIMTNYLMQCS